MARQTVANLKNSVSGQLQGLNLNNVKSLNLALERTARQTSALLDIPETTYQQGITLYDGVTDYTAPTTMFGTSVVDLRPQGTTRYAGDTVQKMPGDQFDREKGYISTSTELTIEYNNGTGVIRIVSPYPTSRIELDPMTQTTGWTASGSASALTTDSTVIWQSPSSLRFTLTGASTGTLSKTISSTDLTSYVGVGVAFVAFRVTTAANLTSITLKIGSDSSDYYSVTATSGFTSAFADAQLMLAKFDLATASKTGSPNLTKTTYVELDLVTSGTEANAWVGDLWISLPYPATLLYKNCAIYLPAGATTPQSTITADTDTIIFTDEAYAIYEIQCAIGVAEQQGGTLASGVIAGLKEKINGVRGYRGVLVQLGLLDIYRANNPSDRLRDVGSYYDGLNG